MLKRRLNISSILRSISLCLCGLLLSSFAFADLVVVVHKESDVTSLSKQQVKMLYLGKNKRLPNDLEVQLVDFAKDNPKREVFYNNAVDTSLTRSVRNWARHMFSGKGSPPTQVDSDAEAVEQLMKAPQTGVAYIDEASVTDDLRIVYRVLAPSN